MKWIKVSERLPKVGEQVCCKTSRQRLIIGELESPKRWDNYPLCFDGEKIVEWLDESDDISKEDVDLLAEALVSYQHTLVEYLTWKSDEYSQKMIPLKIKEVLSLYNKIRL